MTQIPLTFLAIWVTRKLANGLFDAYQNGLDQNTCGSCRIFKAGLFGFYLNQSSKNKQRELIYFFCLRFDRVPGVPRFAGRDHYGYLMKFELELLVGNGLLMEELRKIAKI